MFGLFVGVCCGWQCLCSTCVLAHCAAASLATCPQHFEFLLARIYQQQRVQSAHTLCLLMCCGEFCVMSLLPQEVL